MVTNRMSATMIKWKKIHYVCIQCNRGYISLYWMQWHNQTFHLKGDQPCPCWISYCAPFWKKKPTKCKAARGRPGRPGSTQITCRLCPAKYARSDNLVRHIQTKHFNWTYYCTYCPSRFIHHNTALRHLKRCHPGCPVRPMALQPPPFFRI